MNTSINLNGIEYQCRTVNTIIPLIPVDDLETQFRLHPDFLTDNEQFYGKFNFLQYAIDPPKLVEPIDYIPKELPQETSITYYGFDDDKSFFLKDTLISPVQQMNILVKDFYITNFSFVAFDGLIIRRNSPYKKYDLFSESDMLDMLDYTLPQGIPFDYIPLNPGLPVDPVPVDPPIVGGSGR